MPAVIISRDPEDLARHAADLFGAVAQEAVTARGRFVVALAGGSTPEKTYKRLAASGAAVDWARTYVFMGDERLVRYDDPASNYGMARQALLAHVPIPPDHLFPVPIENNSREQAASAYAATLDRFFGASGAAPPVFDLILLGLGSDGHTASLFPGAPTLSVSDTWVTSSLPGTLPPPVDRVTLTFPVLNAGRRVVFLVAGSEKAAVVQEVLETGADPGVRPSAGVRPDPGALIWLLDCDAAARLSPATRGEAL